MTLSDAFPQYYAEYSSSNSDGCVASFIQGPSLDAHSPSSVEDDCHLCNNNHYFHLVKTYLISQKSHIKYLEEYCISQGIRFKVLPVNEV